MNRRNFLGLVGLGAVGAVLEAKVLGVPTRKSALVPGVQYLSHEEKRIRGVKRPYGRCYHCWILQNNRDISGEAHRVFDGVRERVLVNGKPLENGVIPFENIVWMGITHGDCCLTIPVPNSTTYRWMRQPVTERQWAETGCLARSIMGFPEHKWCLCHPTRHTSLIRLCTSGHSDQVDDYVEAILGKVERFVEDNFVGIRAKVMEA